MGKEGKVKIITIVKISHTTQYESDTLLESVMLGKDIRIKPTYFILYKRYYKSNNLVPGGFIFTTMSRDEEFYGAGWHCTPPNKEGIFTIWERK